MRIRRGDTIVRGDPDFALHRRLTSPGGKRFDAEYCIAIGYVHKAKKAAITKESLLRRIRRGELISTKDPDYGKHASYMKRTATAHDPVYRRAVEQALKEHGKKA
jgi:hypothetical protein